jgi:hypothetical protein
MDISKFSCNYAKLIKDILNTKVISYNDFTYIGVRIVILRNGEASYSHMMKSYLLVIFILEIA